jgi:hypothetical protein
MTENMQYLYLWVCLISLNMMICSCIYVPVNITISFFLWLNNAPLHIYISHFLYPLIYWWEHRLIPQVGYCEWCWKKHGCAGVCIVWWLIFLQVYTQEWYSRIVIIYPVFYSLENLSCLLAVLHEDLIHIIFPLQLLKDWVLGWPAKFPEGTQVRYRMEPSAKSFYF